ncbi:hypothetical protein LCGC14_2703290, partial [marine sediment metagenome]
MLKKLRERAYNFDLFALGNSAVLYYMLIFYLAPLLILLGISPESTVADYQMNYRALFYITIGLIFLILGYRSRLPATVVKKFPSFLKRGWDFSKVPWVFAFVFGVGLIIKYIKVVSGVYFHLNQNPTFVSSPFYSVVGFLGWFGSLALIIAFVSYFYLQRIGDKRYIYWRWIAYGVFIFEIFYALPSCSKLSVIVPIALYLIVRWYLVKREYWRVILSAFVVILLLFPFADFCRTEGGLQGYLVSAGNEFNATDIGDIEGNFLGRINQYHIFSKILENPQPFLYGKSLLSFFVSLG